MRGFSLIETILGSVILMLVILSLLTLLPNTMWTVRMADHRLKAGSLAQSLLEEQRLLPLAQLASGPLPAVQDAPLTYTPTLTVSTPTGLPQARRLHLEVSWVERGQTHTAVRETVVTSVPR